MRLLASLLLLVTACGTPAPEGEPERPDVLMLTLCTLRADHLGAYGYERPLSPNIDRLADEGVVFEHTLTGAPWTRPAIATLLTGQYPRTLEIDVGKDVQIDPFFTSVATHFKRAGYRTLGFSANPNANAVFGHGRGFDVYRDTRKLWRDDYASSKLGGAQVTEAFLEDLEAGAADQPWFGHLILVDVHPPFLRRNLSEEAREIASGRDAVDRYDRQLHYMDSVIGQLLEQLEERGLAPEIVLVTGDHGTGFNEYRQDDTGHGHVLYDSNLWVPFILWAPNRGLSPRRVRERVHSVDVMPTLLDVSGVDFDERSIDGVSQAPAARGSGGARVRRVSVVETNYMTSKSAVLVGTDKLIVRWTPEFGVAGMELYDRAADPGETRNLLEGSDRPKRVARLLGDLHQWRAEHAGKVEGDPPAVDVGGELRKALEALGYVQ
jgi:arylsulfatase A-like enzyme